MLLGKKNVTHRVIDNKTKTYLPPFHIILGLIKMNKQGEGFDYLRHKNFHS